MSNTIDLHKLPHLMSAAWNRGDMDTFYSHIAEEVEVEEVEDVGGDPSRLAGVRGILDRIRTAFPELRASPRRIPSRRRSSFRSAGVGAGGAASIPRMAWAPRSDTGRAAPLGGTSAPTAIADSSVGPSSR